jgi:hypothetical protein
MEEPFRRMMPMLHAVKSRDDIKFSLDAEAIRNQVSRDNLNTSISMQVKNTISISQIDGVTKIIDQYGSFTP